MTELVNIKDALILVADDNAMEVQLTCTILNKEGYQTICCRNGAQVLSLARERKPDLILMDVTMPHFDGFEACRRLKKQQPTADIPIIFISANAENKDRQKAFESGGMDYITKPYEKAELLKKISTHLYLKKALEKLETIAEQQV